MQCNNLIIGSGISGCVLAERLANDLNEDVVIIDKRNHIGGNLYDYKDENGIIIHKYGPHVFHTKYKEIWDYISNFTEWHYFALKVKALVDGNFCDVPFNLNSLFQVFPQSMATNFSEKLTKNYKYGEKISIIELMNHPDKEINFLADFIFKKIFFGYTSKQWKVEDPDKIDKSVLDRIPICISRDERYFSDQFQGIPLYGYTKMIKNMLNNKKIKLILNTNYFDIKEDIIFNKLFFTGMIDEFFNYEYGELEYRSLNFEYKNYNNMDHYQPYPHINYPDNYTFTRSIECKYYLPNKSENTSVVYEYPQDYIKNMNEPFYPVNNEKNKIIYDKYKAKELNNVFFCGRLADYKYYNMDQAIKNALELYSSIKSHTKALH